MALIVADEDGKVLGLYEAVAFRKHVIVVLKTTKSGKTRQKSGKKVEVLVR